MRNYEYLIYTYKHRIAFKYVLDLFDEMGLLSDDESVALNKRARFHDLDKQTLYLVMDKKLSSRYHKKTARHHMGKGNIVTNKSRIDYIEAIIDYECGHLTKPDKPLNAYDTIMTGDFFDSEKYKENMLGICKEFGIDHSYDRPLDDARWKRYFSEMYEEGEDYSAQIIAQVFDYITYYNDESGRNTNVLNELGHNSYIKEFPVPEVFEHVVIHELKFIDGE